MNFGYSRKQISKNKIDIPILLSNSETFPATKHSKKWLFEGYDNLTEDNVDAEFIPPYEPRNPFDLVGFEGRPEPELFLTQRRVAGACVVFENDSCGNLKPLLVAQIHGVEGDAESELGNSVQRVSEWAVYESVTRWCLVTRRALERRRWEGMAWALCSVFLGCTRGKAKMIFDFHVPCTRLSTKVF